MENRKFDSSEYWEQRYAKNGNSGTGSYGKFAKFKADVINQFIEENNVKTLVDFGVGDGNQMELIKIDNYIGIDISKTIINKLKKRNTDQSKKFYIRDDVPKNIKGDLAISCDVLFHLIDTDIWEEYIKDLFNFSDKFIVIYAADFDHDFGAHMNCRKFTPYIEKTQTDWELEKVVQNIYPFNKETGDGSVSNFYFYRKL